MSRPDGGDIHAGDLVLRDVTDDDITVFFAQQLDREARHMAAFTPAEATDKAAFTARWRGFLSEPTIVMRTIVFDGKVAGQVLSYETEGEPEVSYWLGREFWGRGLATRALAAFLAEANHKRPIFARVATDNVASRRVLEKCGFTIIGRARGFARARGEEIEELILQLG